MDILLTMVLYALGYTLLAFLLVFGAYRLAKGRARKVLKICLMALLPAAVVIFLFATGTI
jgi:hypothetical protein